MTGHTLGPWRANLHPTQRQAGRTYGFIHAGAVVPIAAVTLGVAGMSQDEGRANARLIASAPELLAALERVEELTRAPVDLVAHPVTCMETIRALARAAIAKARGR